jgi:hypothetical protein
LAIRFDLECGQEALGGHVPQQRSPVGVDVAIDDHGVVMDGRRALDGRSVAVPFEALVRDFCAGAGYGRQRVCRQRDPDPDALGVITRVCVEPLTPEQADIRSFSDDQNVVHGYAIHRPETNDLTAAHWLANQIGREVRVFGSAHPARYGPDFKVCVAVEQLPFTGSSPPCPQSTRPMSAR